MDVRSLGFRTDLALLTAAGSVVEDRGTHLVVRTPDNPTYYWGNFLLLAHAPVPGGEREVVGAFHTEFPEAGHVSIAVDEPALSDEARAAFEAAGLRVEDDVVLTAHSLTPPAPPAVEVELRPLASEEDWEARARLGRALSPDSPEESFMSYARGANRQEQALEAAGRGRRWGAFVDGRVVSTAGIYLTEEGVARYQTVETHPAHRKQGLASAVVHAAGRYALDDLGARTLVIVADEDGPAIDLYRRLGFADTGRQVTLERRSGESATR